MSCSPASKAAMCRSPARPYSLNHRSGTPAPSATSSGGRTTSALASNSRPRCSPLRRQASARWKERAKRLPHAPAAIPLEGRVAPRAILPPPSRCAHRAPGGAFGKASSASAAKAPRKYPVISSGNGPGGRKKNLDVMRRSGLESRKTRMVRQNECANVIFVGSGEAPE